MKIPGRVQPALTPGVVQRKAVAPWIRETPKAPPAYRPQPVPKVLQTKVSQTTQAGPNRQKAMTFPVHKPPQVLQQRSVRATAGVVQGRAIAANVNRGRTIPQTPVSKSKPRPVVSATPPTRPAVGNRRSGLIQRFCGYQNCANLTCRDPRNHLKEFALEYELLARSVIPYAANQEPDLYADSNATSRHEVTRFMNRTVLGGDPAADGLEHALRTAAAADRYRGGMCNEYSALMFAGLMRSPEISGQPICRHWNSDIGHSIASFGDARVPNGVMVIPDAWTLDRDPLFSHETPLSRGSNRIVAEWADRIRGEGLIHADEVNQAATARFLEAEQNPNIQQQLTEVWNRFQDHHQHVTGRLRQGERLPGIYNYSTNRRPFG